VPTVPTATPHSPATACEHCGAPLGEDQRYCLSCGAASPAARVAPPRSAAAPGVGGPTSPEGPAPGRDLTPVWALGGLLALAVVLIAGVLIGRSGSKPATAAAPIVRVTGGGAATSGGDTASTAGSVATDWPDGASGWTVELGRVAKAGASASSVAAAKSAAAKKGAPKVGVLDSDSYGSLPGGDYVIYSGKYASKAKAAAALKKLKKKYPSAKVVHVSGAAAAGGGSSGGGSDASSPAAGAKAKQAIKDLNKSGGAYEEQQKKKPKTIVVPGKAPPKDNKAPGGGSAGESIG
jgi:hypothetical protein